MGGVIREKPDDDGGWTLEVEFVERDFHRLVKRENLFMDILEEPLADVPVATVI
jgi:hypothetical protein